MERERASGGIGIVGAGIAGLACARLLVEAGLAPTLHEKARRPGGRCSTRREGELRFDHGAQYFTARDPEFVAYAASLRDRGILAPWPGRLVAFGRQGRVELRDEHRRLVARPGMSALPRELARGLDVVSDCRIVALERVGGAWLLRDDEGRDRGRFDQVVLALPADQARELAPPGLREQLETLTMAPTLALMLHLPDGGPQDFEAAFVNDDPVLGWIARDGSKPDRPAPGTWVLHATTAFSTARFAADEEEIAAAMMAAFESLVGRDLRPDRLRLMRWRYARPGNESPVEAFHDRTAGVGACGDWCRGGRIEGAWLSGRAQARLVLDAQRS